jgi:hypothetical protein
MPIPPFGAPPTSLSPAKFKEITTPANPPTGTLYVYSKSGDGLYTLTPGGVETLLSGASVGNSNSPSSNLTVPANTSYIVSDWYEIRLGLTTEISLSGILEIT